MNVLIPDEVVRSIHMTEEELTLELALLLFEKEKLTLAQAARMVGVDRMAFQRELAERKISVHYDVEDFEEDIETLERFGQWRRVPAVCR
ncbi:MAG: UPF0175 family protein [Candidatus Poribacteria bacterium]|nr:UPF0175 family protein [Candidatus Poribacteria bacterium]